MLELGQELVADNVEEPQVADTSEALDRLALEAVQEEDNEAVRSTLFDLEWLPARAELPSDT